MLAAMFAIYFFGTGFMRNTSVYVEDYTVSDDGTEITITFFDASSMGYIRRVSVHQQDGGKLYLDCYAAFGGLNGKIGARNTFTLPLDRDTEIIAVYRAPGCYAQLLVKDTDGIWHRA